MHETHASVHVLGIMKWLYIMCTTFVCNLLKLWSLLLNYKQYMRIYTLKRFTLNHMTYLKWFLHFLHFDMTSAQGTDAPSLFHCHQFFDVYIYTVYAFTLYKQNIVFFQGSPDLSIIIQHMPNVFILLAEVWYM